MNNRKLLHDLVAIGPRRGLSEQKAATLIKSYLRENGIGFTSQEFETTIPVSVKAELFADNEEIPCLGASFVSGKIDNNSLVLNAFTADSGASMIIFNPIAQGVCLLTHKNTPTVAINRDSVVKLVMANEIKGEVVVENFKYQTENILVGNATNPQKIVFAHYDSIVGGGAIDNAGSVDVVTQTITSNKELLTNNLFVYAGSEEESVTNSNGLYGFEIFSKEYGILLDNASEIIVLDGIGVSEPRIISDHVDWVFYVSAEENNRNILWMQCDQSEVLAYYHSALDTIDRLKSEYLEQATELLVRHLNV